MGQITDVTAEGDTTHQLKVERAPVGLAYGRNYKARYNILAEGREETHDIRLRTQL
jgi:hypothetical protein